MKQLLLLPFFLLLSLLLSLLTTTTATTMSNKASMDIVNDAKVNIDVYWHNEADHAYDHIGTVPAGNRVAFRTAKGHSFLVAEEGYTVSSPDHDRPSYTQQEPKQVLWVRGTSQRDLYFEDVVLESEGNNTTTTTTTTSSSSARAAAAAAAGAAGAPPAPQEAVVIIKNNAEQDAHVYWWNEAARSLVFLATLQDGVEQKINSFLGHSLHISLLAEDELEDDTEPNHLVTHMHHSLLVLPPSKGTQGEVTLVEEGKKNRKKAAAYTAVAKTQDKNVKRTIRRVREGTSGPPPPPRQYSVVEEVTKAKAKAAIRTCQGDATCIANELYRGKMARLQQSMQDGMTERDDMEDDYRDYACLQYDTLGPAEVKRGVWKYEEPVIGAAAAAAAAGEEENEEDKSNNTITREIRVDHYFDAERGNARIYLLHDIITPQECQALQERSSGRLATAVVTGDAPGESVVSAARKAKSAMVKGNVDDPTDILGGLVRRVFTFVNEYGGGGYENFQLEGQEPFNVIMYNTSGDEYRPHCDGYCDSSKYMQGGRAATVVLFCKEAARGGQTSFMNADILLKGKAGQAAFFHYRDSEGYVDSGWTKHSGCPIVEGTKFIATQWIREGVSANNPWYWYSPTGDVDSMSSGRLKTDPNY